MTVSGPKIRDFTDKQRSLAVIVESDPVYELLMAIFVFLGESDHGEYEVYTEIQEAIADYGDPELANDLTTLGTCGELGLALVGIAHEMPAPRTADTLAARLS